MNERLHLMINLPVENQRHAQLFHARLRSDSVRVLLSFAFKGEYALSFLRAVQRHSVIAHQQDSVRPSAGNIGQPRQQTFRRYFQRDHHQRLITHDSQHGQPQGAVPLYYTGRTMP